MNKYIFKHESEYFNVEVTTEVQNCTELLRQFTYFLQGCSFHTNTVKNALQNLVDEIEFENDTKDSDSSSDF